MRYAPMRSIPLYLAGDTARRGRDKDYRLVCMVSDPPPESLRDDGRADGIPVITAATFAADHAGKVAGLIDKYGALRCVRFDGRRSYCRASTHGRKD